MQLGDKYFLMVDNSGLTVYSYEGRAISSPKFQVLSLLAQLVHMYKLTHSYEGRAISSPKFQVLASSKVPILSQLLLQKNKY